MRDGELSVTRSPTGEGVVARFECQHCGKENSFPYGSIIKTVVKRKPYVEPLLQLVATKAEWMSGELFEQAKPILNGMTMRRFRQVIVELAALGFVRREVISFGRKGRTTIINPTLATHFKREEA